MNTIVLILMAANVACCIVNTKDRKYTVAGFNGATAVILLATLVTK